MWRHCNGLPLLCRINGTSSSYVFRLQYPRVLYCRIVPIEKLKTLVALEKKKSRASSRKLLVGYMTGGGGCEYFHETFVRHHSNQTSN